MTIALVTNNRGLTAVTSGGSNPTITMAAGASIAVGNTLVLTASYDNSGTLGVDPDMFVVSSSSVTTQVYNQDLRGNWWWRLAKAIKTSGAANDGAVADIWACLVTNAYTNGDAITLQFSFPVAGLNTLISEFSGVNPRSYSVIAATSSTGNGTTIGPAATTTPTAIGQMVVGVAAIEDNTTVTGDGDSTGGTWSTLGTFGVGSGATGNSIMGQYKVVTSTAAQDWKVTKTGAADWAAIAVVFDAFTSVASPFSSGNPNYTCIAGAEVLGLTYDNLPVDTGTEYLQTHQIFPNSYGTQNYNVASLLLFDPLGGGATAGHHGLIHEMYSSGAENIIDPVITQNLPVVGAGVGGGASVSFGTAADALVGIGGAYVTLPNNGYVEVLFNPVLLTTQFANYRIVRWGVQYLAWKDDSSAPGPGEGMIAEWRDSSANNLGGSAATISAWLVQNYQRDVQFETRWIGEINPIIRGKGEILAQNAPYNAAFTINDLSHMALADQTTRMRFYGASGNDPSQTTVYLDYIQAVVELVPERRLANGTRLISNVPAFVSAHWYSDALGYTQLWSALNSNNRWQVPAAANTYVMVTREVSPASPGDYYANLASTGVGSIARSVGFNEAIGPSFLLRAAVQPRGTLDNATGTGQPVLRRAVVNGGVLASTPQNLDTYVLSMAGLDLLRFNIDGSFWPAYDFAGAGGSSSTIYTGNSISENVQVPGSVTYARVKVLVAPDKLTTADLTVTVEKPSLTVLATATLTAAAANAAPDVGNGWKEVTLALNTSITPSAGQAVIRFASTTAITAPWLVSQSNPMASLDQFGYNFGQGQGDFSAVLQCTLAAPTVSLASTSQAIYRPTGRCLNSTISLPQLTLTNGATYNWISIERSVDGGTTWIPVTLLASPANGQVYTDAAAPWDLPTSTTTYRVTGYRNSDQLSVSTVTAAWNGSAGAPGMGFGLAVGGTLYAYTVVDESEVKPVWTALNPVSIVPLLGVDYQIPIRSTEERGLSVQFMVIVDRLGVCASTDAVPWSPEVLTPGAQSFSPAPFAAIRSQAKTNRFELLLPGGHTRWVTMSLGSLTIRTSPGIYLAEIILTDVTAPTINPYADTT